jgi:hypothetical protein
MSDPKQTDHPNQVLSYRGPDNRHESERYGRQLGVIPLSIACALSILSVVVTVAVDHELRTTMDDGPEGALGDALLLMVAAPVQMVLVAAIAILHAVTRTAPRKVRITAIVMAIVAAGSIAFLILSILLHWYH